MYSACICGAISINKCLFGVILFILWGDEKDEGGLILNRFLLIGCGLFFAVAFTGCASKDRIELVDGTFGGPIPKENHGVGREVPAHSSLYGFTVSGNYFMDREVEMSAHNKDTSFSETVHMPDSRADVTYRLPKYSGSIDFEMLHKYEMFMSGFGLGVEFGEYKSLYLQFMFGLNGPHYELGIYGNAVFALGVESSFRGYKYTAAYTDMGYHHEAFKSSELSEIPDKKLQPFGTLGAFAGVYWGPVGLNASVSYVSPWSGMEDDLLLTIKFPTMISLYTGASLWIGKSWKVSAGPTFVLGGEDPAIALGGSLEYWI